MLSSKYSLLQLAKDTQRELIDMEPYTRYPMHKHIENNSGELPFWFTFNYTDFHNRNVGSIEQDPKLAQEKQSVRSFQGRDYFGFPLELSLSVTASQIVCLIHYNPNIVSLRIR